MRKAKLYTISTLLTVIIVVATLLFYPFALDKTYSLNIKKNQGYSQIVSQLKKDGVIKSELLMKAVAYSLGGQDKLRPGVYRFRKSASTWHIIRVLLNEKPEARYVTILEGANFSQMRATIAQSGGLQHVTKGLSEAELLKQIDPNTPYTKAEGLFFPDTYQYNEGETDLNLYTLAYKNMQRQLAAAWEDRQYDLPYKDPYELLIMASIIERETGHEADRRHVAAVFVNRLNIGMRLQTDPTVMYGISPNFKGRLRRADLRRDTPYNTYTRAGLTPTPISLPSQKALEAAAHPSSEKFLYFVSMMDGSGLSYFSHDLPEHNQAVRKYILKRGG
ncbi:MAG: endolytic transglycosylase MltG [Neisseriaceae bacterium]|nr:endolytic transglycosylase MltG [Neisseriaceae bacterium]MBP6860899.1 endolytic transglycosylase MltG [Neisseriaceae bacterium]